MELINRRTGQVYEIAELKQNPTSGRVEEMMAVSGNDRLTIQLQTLSHYQLFKKTYQLKGVVVHGL